MLRIVCLLLILCFVLQGFSENLRPQEPKLPYPYQEEEIIFNAADGVALAGTLTVPNGEGPFPAVLLLHGSAPLDRDSQMLGHKPFLVWADYLTRRGIAVLRFDKRGAGKSSGDYSTSTIQDFASDAVAAVKYLKARRDIRAKQIGVIGHSEGGITATIAASRCNEVAFVVLMAAPAFNGEQTILMQEALLQRADKVDEKLILKNREFREEMFALLKSGKKLDNSYLDKLTTEERKIAETYYSPSFFNSTWFRYWLTYDPIPILKQLTVPVLVLNGELDLIVPPEQNLKLIATVLKAVKHKDYTVMQLPKLNHAFQTCKLGTMAECASIEETASPLALKTLIEWIVERTIALK